MYGDTGEAHARPDQGSARVGVMAGAAVLAVVAIAGGLLSVRATDGPDTQSAQPQATVALPEPTPTPTPTPDPACSTAARPFVPTAVAFPGVVRRVPVVAMPRDADNVPGIPPLTTGGKTEMAFDLGSGILPGARRGNALLNAHTWPDGSALGNKLLAGLHEDDQIVVHGPLGRICYRVTDRVEVPATDRGVRYYARKGRPQVAIVVCSGKRLGAGEWTKRTLWFASPVV